MSDTNLRPSKCVLLVDSDPSGRVALRVGLNAPDLRFIEASTVIAAQECLAQHQLDLILCEVELSDGSGFAFARDLKDDASLSPRPMLLLMSRWSYESDRILGFECGADDFVTKPFYTRELASRVRALLRRRIHSIAANGDSPSPSKLDGSVDLGRRIAQIGDEQFQLTLSETLILAALGRGEGRVITRSELVGQMSKSSEIPSERSIDAHVKGLRHKLGAARSCIETVRGEGYRYSGAATLVVSNSTEN